MPKQLFFEQYIFSQLINQGLMRNKLSRKLPLLGPKVGKILRIRLIFHFFCLTFLAEFLMELAEKSSLNVATGAMAAS
jgi:hypothetical protein